MCKTFHCEWVTFIITSACFDVVLLWLLLLLVSVDVTFMLPREGDELDIYDNSDDTWWQGCLRGTVGVFPAAYVKLL